ncbi:MAG: dTDP-4-dehydrorhamnose reductase [Candidatus Omnitrophota bacterium]
MAKTKKVLITGSTGMLGSDLCQESSLDYQVFCLAKPIQETENCFCADIADRDAIRDIFRRIHPDIIIHTAAFSNVDGCELNPDLALKINAEGTGNLAHYSKEIDAVFVYIGTDYVFSGNNNKPYKEDDDASPVNVYGKTKLLGEEIVKGQLKRYFIVRTSWLFGRGRKNFVDMVLEKAKTGSVIKIVSDKVSSPTYTKDLSLAILNLINKDHYGIFHIANQGSCSWFDWAAKILEYAKLDATKLSPISLKELNLAAKRPLMTSLDISKFVKVTGYPMRSWQDALGEFICSKN